MVIKIPISAGELIDKITILEIKTEFISDKIKINVIINELDQLIKVYKKIQDDFPKLVKKINTFKKKLYGVNRNLWDTENKLRQFESKNKFQEEFIEAARMVYKFNDKRAKLKKEVNKLLGSKISEVKSYSKY
jgi:predicted  nucleic acid-binding Zn-ribbon protein